MEGFHICDDVLSAAHGILKVYNAYVRCSENISKDRIFFISYLVAFSSWKHLPREFKQELKTKWSFSYPPVYDEEDIAIRSVWGPFRPAYKELEELISDWMRVKNQYKIYNYIWLK
mgnify:CR=1 FL=1